MTGIKSGYFVRTRLLSVFRLSNELSFLKGTTYTLGSIDVCLGAIDDFFEVGATVEIEAAAGAVVDLVDNAEDIVVDVVIENRIEDRNKSIEIN